MTTRCDRPGCNQPALYRVTGARYPRPVHACDQHLEVVQHGAGVPCETVGVVDDGQDVLFDMPGEDGAHG